MKRRFLIALTVAAAVTGALAGGVYAYWRTSGSGSGAASVGTAQAVTVEAATGITLDNPNSYAVTIVGIVQNGPASPVSGGSCTSANSGVTVPTQTGLTLSVPSGAGQTVHIPNGAAMSASSDSNCQGVSFDITVTLTVQR
jgi:hypothetical protein